MRQPSGQRSWEAWLTAMVGAAAWAGVALAQPASGPIAPQAAGVALTQPGAEAGLYKSMPGPWTVKVIDETWKDDARNRVIPVRMYLPEQAGGAGGDEKRPVLIFSHGLGGSGLNYGYFGKHLASHGYIVLAPTHPGSDTEQAGEWIRQHGGLFGGGKPRTKEENQQGDAPQTPAQSPQRDAEPHEHERAEKGPEAGAGMMPGMTDQGGWMMTTINTPDNLHNRPRDISFVIDRLAAHPLLSTIADTQKIGVAGHSFGAYTAMAVGGMTVEIRSEHGSKTESFRDARVRAVLPMSPEGSGTMGIAAGAWSKFAAPGMFLTGTSDYGIGPRSAAWRSEAFHAAKGVDRAMVTLNDAGHMTFANPGEKSVQQAANKLGMGLLLLGQNNSKKQAAHIALINSLATMFFDGYVRDDVASREKLREFCAAKRADCEAEFVPAANLPTNPSPMP